MKFPNVMNRRIFYFLCLVQVLALSAGCGEQQAAQSPKGRPPSPVRVATVAHQEIQRSVTLVGTVEPWKRSVVATEIEGLVVEFLVEEGMAVKRGQVLARLRTTRLNIRLNSALASHREAQTRFDQAGKDLVRVKALFEKELVTQKEYDDAIAEESALRQRLNQLQTMINQVRDELAKSRIMAPFGGWIIEEFTEVGQWVEAGGPVVELVDLTRLQVEVPLPERFVRDVQVNDPVSVVFDGLPGFKTEGRVFSVVAQADLTARTFPIKLEIPNPKSSVKSGMVSRVTLSVGAPYQALVVPKDALVLRGGREFVFLVQEGKVNQIPVTPVLHLNEVVEVAGDLQPGMTVVVEGNERLLPGQPVRILDSTG
ncbi:MAG: efflux RND transporter periplasmic adaptor subunit [Nitrospirota bacterium]|nr:MAG: efflux RND transporter periplasmic adaptor subunit [Nitrospirota bacterium]